MIQALALLALLGAFAAFYARMRGLNGCNPTGELGVIFMAWCLCYAIFPVIAFAFSEAGSPAMMDTRIAIYGFDTDAITTIAVYNLAFCGAFMASYVWCCRTPLVYFGRSPRCEPSAKQIHVLLLVALLLWVPSTLLNLALARPGEGYGGVYIQYSHLPLILQQLLPILNAVTHVSVIALVSLLALLPRGKGRWPIILILLCYAAAAVSTGGRAGLMSLLIALATALFIAGVRVKLWTILSAALGIGFLMAWIGASRQGVDWDAVIGQNEFLSVHGTQVHIASLSLSGVMLDFPTEARFGDIVSLLPQQVVPFTKIDAATWYMQSFFPLQLETGSGFSFSVIAECFMGFGLLEAGIRGLALGFIFSWLRNLFARNNNSPLLFLSYIYLCATCYLAYRSTTFTHLRLFLFNFLPLMVMCWVLNRAFLAAFRNHMPANSLMKPIRENTPRAVQIEGSHNL